MQCILSYLLSRFKDLCYLYTQTKTTPCPPPTTTMYHNYRDATIGLIV